MPPRFSYETEQRKPGELCLGHFYDRDSGDPVDVPFPFALGQLGTDEYWRGPIGMIREKIARWSITEAKR